MIKHAKSGDSIFVNGNCLTVISSNDNNVIALMSNNRQVSFLHGQYKLIKG
ncbi:hypothetical protein [Jeotgalibacillus marinus]|uniref:Lumazine-binding domain-containing protein n=1 Tax=Jeotgalibacillus marinus TaxID=86667 RepID=A0ABV3Q4W8_9BACL